MNITDEAAEVMNRDKKTLADIRLNCLIFHAMASVLYSVEWVHCAYIESIGC